MRILYHHRTQAEDGQAVHIRSLIEAFEAEGHTVLEEALVRRIPSQPDSPPPAGAAAPVAPPKRGAFWSLVGKLPRFAHELAEYAYSAPARRRLVRAGRGFDAQVLYERYAFGNTAGVSAAKQLGIPLVLEVNSPMVLELSRTRGLSFPGLAARTERWIFRGADLVCVVTAVLGEMLEELGVDPARLLITPNGVHPEQYTGADRGQARAGLGLGGLPGPVLGFVGYYRDWHRLDLVVEGLATAGLQETRLVLVGDGPAEQTLRALAQKCGVEQRVHFVGPRPHREIPALLPAFDVALVPAINPYASPLKLHEYMAAGLASVAPDQPNLREVLKDGTNALLFPPGDGDGLLSAVTRLVEDVELRGRLGAAARDTITARDLTWRGNARRVVQAVREL